MGIRRHLKEIRFGHLIDAQNQFLETNSYDKMSHDQFLMQGLNVLQYILTKIYAKFTNMIRGQDKGKATS